MEKALERFQSGRKEEMKVNAKIKIVKVLLFVIIIQFFAINGFAAEKGETIKVGFYNSNFHYQNSDGTYGGYGYEYLQELAQYTGWEYEYIQGTLKECHERLRKGEIDFLGAVQHTEEREEYLAYPKLSSGTSYAILCVRNNNYNFAFNDYEAFNGKKVGLLQESNNNSLFNKFCKENNISFTPFYYESQEELSNALYQDKVDLILTNSIRKDDNQKAVAQFSPNEFYFVTGKGNNKILAELNAAQEQIKIINPNFDALLYMKYYQNRNSKNFVLTKEEEQYVFEKNTVKVAVLPNLNPIQMYNEKTNEFSGISIDILKLITESTGLQFEFILADNYGSAVELLKQHKAEMICGIPEESNQAFNDNLSLSTPYLKTQTVMLKNRNVKDFYDVTVAVIKNEKLPLELENSNVVFYDTLEDCINAVNSGKSDICYGNIYVIEKIIQNPKLNNIALSSAVNLDSNVCFGFAKPVDVSFVTLFNKSLNYISDNEVQEIVYNNTLTKNYKMTISSILYMRPDIFVAVISAISMIIIFSVVYVFYSRMNNQKLIAKTAMIQGERYRVATEISNDILFEYDIETDTMTNAQKFVEIFGREPVIPAFLERLDDIQNVHVEDWSVYEDYCMSLKSGIDMVESEFRLLGKDGNYVWCHLRGKTIFNKKNEPIKVIGKIVNIDIQKKELQKLLFKAQRDPLTNLYNKINTKDLINQSIRNAPVGTKYSLMIIDIDNFKKINDTFGHLLGDKVLVEIVKNMRAVLEEKDIAGRIGGDEFVIFIRNDKGKENVCRKAKCLGDAVFQSSFEEDAALKISISIGIANYPENGKIYDELLDHADKALYCVKNKGKNSFDFYFDEK